MRRPSRYSIAAHIVDASARDGGTERNTYDNTDTFTPNTTESGSLRIQGTIAVEGVSEGRAVKDKVTIDVTRSLTGSSWYYNGAISNANETRDILME